ncbi:MAG: DALR anticodon-binding domain-containing protein [Pseudonocardiaceae bacterium]
MVRGLLTAPPGGSEVGEQPSALPGDRPADRLGDRLRVVQLAHARLASLVRNAADLGIAVEEAPVELLEDAREVELIWMLGDFPRVAALGEPSRLLRYLEGLARYHHNFSDVCRMLPMGDEAPGPLHSARLALCEATIRVLADGLRLLGTNAPERM